MEVIFVSLACIYHTGCTEVSQQYYRSHVELVSAMSNSEKYVKKHTPEIVTQYVAPYMAMSIGYRATIKLNKYWALQAGKKDGKLSFNYEF
jgi:hypothetical protein